MNSKKVIVALDSDNLKKIKKLVNILKSEAYAFKIGYEFFFNFGIDGYNQVKKICPNIFLDLKLHDIPNTVEKGVKAIGKLKPLLTTVHISGGNEMMRASIKNKKYTKIEPIVKIYPFAFDTVHMRQRSFLQSCSKQRMKQNDDCCQISKKYLISVQISVDMKIR